jgi:hypothetical protein
MYLQCFNPLYVIHYMAVNCKGIFRQATKTDHLWPMFGNFIALYCQQGWAHGSVVGWDTVLQAARSPVRVLGEVDFFNLPNPSSCTMALGFLDNELYILIIKFPWPISNVQDQILGLKCIICWITTTVCWSNVRNSANTAQIWKPDIIWWWLMKQSFP